MAKRLTLPSLVIVLSVGVIAGAGPRDAGITLEDLVSSDGIATPTLSPGGREFAFTSDGQIKRLAVDGGWPVVSKLRNLARSFEDRKGRAVAHFSLSNNIVSSFMPRPRRMTPLIVVFSDSTTPKRTA